MSKKTGHIYLYGEIVNLQSPDNASWGVVSLLNIQDEIFANADAEELMLHIHSPGGDVNEGFAIYDALKATGKTITTIIEGKCSSIATVPAFAGEKRIMTRNSEFMIHNPWGAIQGTAEEIQKYADQVKAYEEKILNFYVKQTGGDKKQISAMMEKETVMEPDQALELKFITEVSDGVVAFAKIKSQSQKPNKTMFEDLKKKLNEISEGIKASMKAAGIKNLLQLSATDGRMLDIDTEANDPVVGNAVKITDKEAPDGEYALPDGRTIVVASGKISEIKAKPVDKNDTADVSALKTQITEKDQTIATLTAKVTALETAQTQAKEATDAIMVQFEEIKNLSSKFTVKDRVPPTNTPAPVAKKDEEKSAEDFRKEAEERRKSYKGAKVTA